MTPETLAAAMEATWPPAASHRTGPFTIRDGQGGGKRVSAATLDGAGFTETDLAAAEDAMRALGQPPLFQIRAGDAALDAALAARGYGVVDPVTAYAAPVAVLATPAPPLTAFPHWPPLGIVVDIWQAGGIGPARLAVMDRVTGPKTAILGRTADHPSGAAFVALAGTTAMLHALEVVPALRRQGSANNILRAAAVWAQDQGADSLGLVVTAANTGARALYASLGMQLVGHYHYRQA